MNDINAVSLYQNEGLEDFPVLKAFQQYIDAEQAKARKRMLMLCAFFGILMTLIITVFVVLLINVSSHNQSLNDRLIEYAMKDRDQRAQVVVQQPTSDNNAIITLANKLDEIQKNLSTPKPTIIEPVVKPTKSEPSAEEQEIIRLKAMLSAEKERVQIEKEKRRQIELDQYRRKHYPELYEEHNDYDARPVRKSAKKRTNPTISDEDAEADAEIKAILEDVKAIRYYDDDDVKPKKQPSSPSSLETPPKKYSIPVDIKGSSTDWNIPES